MQLKDIIRRTWRSVEAFASALDHDPHAEINQNIEWLKRDGQLQRTALAALSKDVRDLSAQVRGSAQGQAEGYSTASLPQPSFRKAS